MGGSQRGQLPGLGLQFCRSRLPQRALTQPVSLVKHNFSLCQPGGLDGGPDLGQQLARVLVVSVWHKPTAQAWLSASARLRFEASWRLQTEGGHL